MPANHDTNVVTVGTLHISWPLVIGFCALALPTAYKLSSENWSQEAGAHGPLVLITAAWLLWRQLPELQKNGTRGRTWDRNSGDGHFPGDVHRRGSSLTLSRWRAGGLYGAGVSIFLFLVRRKRTNSELVHFSVSSVCRCRRPGRGWTA